MTKILNCTQHSFSKKQIKALRKKFIMEELHDLSEENYDLFMQLSNMQGDENLKKLADELVETIASYKYAVFPVGSPAFMAEVMVAYTIAFFQKKLKTKILFSHSHREMVEEKDNGSKKRPKFYFVSWIEIEDPEIKKIRKNLMEEKC